MQGVIEYEVQRDWLVETFCPEDYAQAARRQAARDRVGYLLDRLHPRGAQRPPLSCRWFPEDDKRERGVVRVTWRHLDIDLTALLKAAQQPHKPTLQEKVMTLAARPLLEGTAYPWLQRTEFRQAGACLDAAYLAALCSRADSLLVPMENARAEGRVDEAVVHRTRVLPLLDRAADRLQGAADTLDAPEFAALRPFPKRLEDLCIRAAYSLPEKAAPTRIAPTPAAPASRIRRPITRFFGREQETQHILSLLTTERLVTLTGTGGCGKTRLALEVAAALEKSSQWDVCPVELASLKSSALLPQTVAMKLGLAVKAQFVEGLISYFQVQKTPTLLLLDNCEHLVDACAALVEALLQACPGLKVLATSRKPLNIDGEHLHRLLPLPFPGPDFPGPDLPDPVAALLRYDAARLFVDRTRQFRSFTLGPDNIRPISAICAALDGIPLALELAAARAKLLTIEKIAEKLGDRFPALADGRRTALPRHRTLRAAIDWSYDLLSEPERALLCRLSVFAGGWTLDAAEAVGASEDLPSADVPATLDSLADNSLVAAAFSDTPDRCRILETVRRYALDRLRERGEWEATRWRHAEWFLRLAEEAEAHLTGAGQKHWLDRLETEHDNLRAAMTWFGQHTEGGEACLRLAAALSEFWRVRGFLGEGRQWLTEALRGGGNAPAPARARALNTLGSLALCQGDLPAAWNWCEESLALYREVGDTQGIGKALHGLGNVAFYQAHYAVAREKYEESLKLSRLAGDNKGAAHALNNLGSTALYQSDLPAARDCFEESLNLFRVVEDMQGVRKVSHNLGNLAYYQGNYAGARERYEECLRLLQDVGDRRDRAYTLNNLASAALPLDDFKAVQAALAESLALFQEVGDTQGKPLVLAGFASLAAAQNQGARAGRLWGAAEVLREVLGVPLHESDRDSYDQEVSGCRMALGSEAFEAAWAEGRAMAWEQAVALALGEDSPERIPEGVTGRR